METHLHRRAIFGLPVALGMSALVREVAPPPDQVAQAQDTDAGPGLEAAIRAALESGLSTVEVPEGRYRIQTPVRVYGEEGRRSLTIRGTGTGTQLVVETGARRPALTFTFLEELRLEGLTFVGTPSVNTDAKQTLRMFDVHHAEVVGCGFYGLSSLVADGSILHAERTDLLVERCTFRGCTTNSGLDAPIVNNEDWRGVVVKSTRFIDYGDLDGTYHSMTPVASSAGFIRLGEPFELSNALGQGAVSLDDVRVDEGCVRALFVHASKRKVQSIHIRGMRVNGSVVTGATALHVQHTRRLRVEACWFGYRSNPGGKAIGLFSVDSTELSDTLCVDNMDGITADASCGVLVLERCTFGSLDSKATRTDVDVVGWS